jgi:hypothetical protein
MLEEAGFKPGEDFHYDSSAGAGALSPAAVAHLAKENPEGIRETLAKHRIPGPCDIAPEETGRGEGGEMMLSYVAVAKLLTANLSGLDPNADPEIASASAIDMMRSDGLPEADAIELVSNAKANEDGARLRLVQRLGPALRRQWHKKD